MPSVSVVIPAFNAERTLPATLNALAAQSFDGPCEVVVADDGSSDRTVEVAENSPIVSRVLRQSNQGPAAARNLAVSVAAGEVLAFTDADCVPASDWLERGVASLDGSDLVQGAVRPIEGRQRGPFARTIWVVAESGLYETANLFCWRDLFDRLGGFEAFLEVGADKQLAEDAWFGWRARREGASTRFDPDLLVHHEVFERSALEFIRDRRRLKYFPAIVRKIPELRQTLFFGRIFLDRRTAEFDLAFAGVAAALAFGPPWLSLSCVPYAVSLLRRGWRLRAPQVPLVEAAADAYGFATMLVSSIRNRRLVI